MRLMTTLLCRALQLLSSKRNRMEMLWVIWLVAWMVRSSGVRLPWGAATAAMRWRRRHRQRLQQTTRSHPRQQAIIIVRVLMLLLTMMLVMRMRISVRRCLPAPV
jgi:Na+/melibiose symporter-like transporter